MTYYRVAIRTQPSADLRRLSTRLTSFQAVSTLLQMYRGSSHRMRVFFASSVDALDTLLARENQGQECASVSATQVIGGWRAASGALEEGAGEAPQQAQQKRYAVAASSLPAAASGLSL